MHDALFVVDTLEDVVDMFVHNSNSVEPLFCGGRADFIVVIEPYGAWITAVKTSVGAEFVGSGGSGIIGGFCER